MVALDVWSIGRKMYSGCSVVKHGSYQLTLSEGLAESDRSAMHQYATLLSNLTVATLRPRGEKRREAELLDKLQCRSSDSDCTPTSQEES